MSFLCFTLKCIIRQMKADSRFHFIFFSNMSSTMLSFTKLHPISPKSCHLQFSKALHSNSVWFALSKSMFYREHFNELCLFILNWYALKHPWLVRVCVKKKSRSSYFLFTDSSTYLISVYAHRPFSAFC